MAQDLGKIGKAKLFTFTGGVSANTIYYDGVANREPFTYIVNGNVNVNVSGVYDIPFSFSYSNQKFQNSQPFSFNRLSMHPSYKWIKTHIGDVSMTFSPYTLSGHQFTGGGVELTPKGKVKVSAMYGRLLKKVAYDTISPQSQPGYERWGYGLKTEYTEERFSVGAILFSAKDRNTQFAIPLPAELALNPKANIVVSLLGKLTLFDKANLQVEVASSAVTEDLNATAEEENPGILSGLLQSNNTTAYYTAYNARFSYQVGTGEVGIGYERIDPEYRTFGAYFFNNDLENITLDASQSIFNNKVTIAFNAGLQHDDLNKTKSSRLERVVSSVNLSYAASEKINISAGYSNFQSFTNIKNQFDQINEITPTDNLDTLNFRQLSQNANLNASFILKDTEDKHQDFSISTAFQGAVNTENGAVTPGGETNFYNGGTTYTLGYPKRSLSIATTVNTTYSVIDTLSSITWGPTLSATKQLFDKKLRTTGSVSYNQSSTAGTIESKVTNVRLTGNYVYKKQHNFSLNFLSQFKNTTTATQDFTATFAYTYNFAPINPKLKLFKLQKKRKRKKKGSSTSTWIRFKHRDSLYQGVQQQVSARLARMLAYPQFSKIPAYKKQELAQMHKDIAKEKDTEIFVPKAKEFLNTLYSYEDFLMKYNTLVYTTLTILRKDMYRMDRQLEGQFVKAKVKVDAHELHGKGITEKEAASRSIRKAYEDLEKASDNALEALIAHRWLLPIVSRYRTIDAVTKPDQYLAPILKEQKDKIFKMYDEDVPADQINLYLISTIIEYYFKVSKNYTDPNVFELKYVERQ